MNYPTKLLDEMWRTVCKARDDYKCAVCTQTEYVNVHHIIGRQNYGTRWLPENGVCLCPTHHKFSRTDSAHINPLQFISSYVTCQTEEFLKERCHDEKDAKRYYDTLYSSLLTYDTLIVMRMLAKCDRWWDRAIIDDERRAKRSADRAASKLARSASNNRDGT